MQDKSAAEKFSTPVEQTSSEPCMLIRCQKHLHMRGVNKTSFGLGQMMISQQLHRIIQPSGNLL